MHFKSNSDLVHNTLPYEAVEEFWKWCSDINSSGLVIHLHPYGGRMNEISESETPFPHRKGVLYELLHVVMWMEDKDGESLENYYNKWIRGLYEFMAPYVSKRPRGAIVNSRDLDLGSNNVIGNSYSIARVWGSKYFKNNFKSWHLLKV
ncbi:berberine bridge enzyme-like 28 [Coffea eugenioides]|uniref:Berberine bridge enzyme-like 28 n=1 Tax=Coffea arabica TaxID=13443 RepID=A0A6P6TW47_COFAR|nr:berberine bridge enzyme-like 28 [Coffea arabica]XP_027182339.1 berberine bridge enzyme-like 28 [Coffea eugenioides]